jgi:hypothetical protein
VTARRRPDRTLVTLEMRSEPEAEFELLAIEPAREDGLRPGGTPD